MSNASDANSGSDLPIYAVRLTERAVRDINAALVYMTEQAGDEIGRQWRRGIADALATLATLPSRCPIAPEAEDMSPPVVRQLVYRRTPGTVAWRILFRILEASAEEMPHVDVLSALHASRRPTTRKEAREIDAQR